MFHVWDGARCTAVAYRHHLSDGRRIRRMECPERGGHWRLGASIALPEAELRRGYDKHSWSHACYSGAVSLGILIPPSGCLVGSYAHDCSSKPVGQLLVGWRLISRA